MQKHLLLLFAGLGIYTAGFLCSRWLAPESSTAPEIVRARESQVVQTSAKKPKGPKALSFSERFEEIFELFDELRGRQELDALGEDLSLAEVQAAMADLSSLKPAHRDTAKRLLLRRWGQLDPKAALAFSVTERSKHLSDGTASFSVVFQAWSEKDPKTAEAAIARLPNDSLKALAKEALGRASLERDPARGLALVLEASRYKSDRYNLHEAIKTVAAKDPAIALATVMQLKEPQAFTVLAQGWVQKDPAGALAWARKLPPSENRNAIFSVLAESIASSDPRQATLVALEAERGTKKPDPMSVAGMTQMLTDESLTGKALSRWATTDWKAAYDWIHSVPLQPEETDYLAMAAAAFLQQGGAGFMDRLKTDTMERGLSRLDAAITQWASSDLETAISWTQQQTNPAVKKTAWPKLAGALAATDPMRAIGFAETLDPETKNRALNSVVERWANQDPAAAAAFVSKEPEGMAKQQRAENVAFLWAIRDRAAADKWIASLPVALQNKLRTTLPSVGQP